MIAKEISLLLDKAFINGRWIDAIGGKTYTVRNPLCQLIFGTVPDMNEEDTRLAIGAAHDALPEWRRKTADQRARLLKKWFSLIIENIDDLAYILTTEQGKPIKEAKGEIAYGASFIEWFAEEARRVYGEVIPGHASDKRIWVTKEPIGVVAAITPWNFPNAMITRKVAPALAAGCTVVIKPSEDTPLSALALAKLASMAGFPDGVINIVTTADPASVGRELCHNPKVRKLSFTGSTPVGKLLMKQCADTVKKVSLELGGNAPFIILDDAIIDDAVEGAIASKYRNAGQTCICTNRILVHEKVYDEFIAKFSEKVSQLVIGNGLNDQVDVGPLINNEALEKVKNLIDGAIKEGAKLISKKPAIEVKNNCIRPVILNNVTTEMTIAHEEIFGPVSTVFKFKTDDEAIEIANNTPYGLASYFYGQNINRILTMAESLEYGMVGINTGMISTAVAPFGGIKQSGIGREGSKYGLDDFLELKYICLGGVKN